MADLASKGARTSVKARLIWTLVVFFSACLCLVIAFYGYFGYQAWQQKRHMAFETATLSALFKHDDGRYLYVKMPVATLRKGPSETTAPLDELAIGRLVYNFDGSRAETSNGYIAVNLAPDSSQPGWIRIDELAGEFPDVGQLIGKFSNEKNPAAKLEVAELVSQLEPGNPDAWRPILSIARQLKDATLVASASAGLHASEQPVFLIVNGQAWGVIDSATLGSRRPEVGTRVATSGAQPVRYRFQGGNECHIQALGPVRPSSSKVTIASNRPQWFRPLALKGFAPELAEKYRVPLERFLAQRDDVPPTIRDELTGKLMRAFSRVPGSSYVLVSAVVLVPSEGDQAYFRANMFLDTSAASPEFVSVLTEWISLPASPAEVFMVGEKNPQLTLALATNMDGGEMFTFFQIDSGKRSWRPAFEARVPAC